MLRRIIRFIKSPFVRNCLTGDLMLNIRVSYIHINNIQGYVAKDLGCVINSCYILDSKKLEDIFNSYKITHKPNAFIYRFRNIFN